jgi:periplasmic divalent cation tolerance protein
MTDKIVVLSTCGSRDEARRIARRLVERRVAACVSVAPGVESVYRWQGDVENSEEWLLVIKSTREAWEALVAELRAGHSYQVPEVLALPVFDGFPPYLEWIAQQVSKENAGE